MYHQFGRQSVIGDKLTIDIFILIRKRTAVQCSLEKYVCCTPQKQTSYIYFERIEKNIYTEGDNKKECTLY